MRAACHCHAREQSSRLESSASEPTRRDSPQRAQDSSKAGQGSAPKLYSRHWPGKRRLKEQDLPTIGDVPLQSPSISSLYSSFCELSVSISEHGNTAFARLNAETSSCTGRIGIITEQAAFVLDICRCRAHLRKFERFYRASAQCSLFLWLEG